MKEKIIQCTLLSLLLGCGPDRDFEDKNIFGSQTMGITSSSAEASSSTGNTSSAWPQDNLGYNVSQDLPTWLTWTGFSEGAADASKLTTLTIDQWYDPDGSQGINAVLFLTSKFDCSACTKESKELQAKIESWAGNNKGIKVVILVINNSTNGPPNSSSTLQWKSQFNLIGAAVVSDPSVTFSIASSFATPLRTVVDPRTMKVFEVGEGYTGEFAALEALADGNK